MVYFIHNKDNDLIKIGRSHNVQSRLYTISGDLEVLGVMEGDYEEEQNLHRKFKNSNVSSEWFKPTKELLKFIDENTSKEIDCLEGYEVPGEYNCVYCGRTFFREFHNKFYCSVICRDILKAKRIIANHYDCEPKEITIIVNNISI